MKRRLFKILISAVFCLLPIALAGCQFIGCVPTSNDVVPKRLGDHEGLWMYFNNTRSRTDGTEKQTILEELEYGGNNYTAEQFEINCLSYLTGINEIVYAVTLPEAQAQLLYRYNYKHKTGEILYVLPKVYDDISLQVSDKYLYAKAKGLGILYDSRLNLIGCDFFNLTLDNDILYCFEKDEYCYILQWYVNGAMNTALLEYTREYEKYVMEHAGDYIYVFPSDGYTLYCCQYINLITGEQGAVDKSFEGRHVFGGQMFVIIAEPSGHNIYKMQGSDLTMLYELGNLDGTEQFPARFMYDDGYLYVEAEYCEYSGCNNRSYSLYYAIDGSSYEVQKVSKPQDYPDMFKLTVGEYTFYQNKAYYSTGFMTGSNCCYYLYRENAGKREIMGYTLTEWWGNDTWQTNDGRCFYNDICEF